MHEEGAVKLNLRDLGDNFVVSPGILHPVESSKYQSSLVSFFRGFREELVTGIR